MKERIKHWISKVNLFLTILVVLLMLYIHIDTLFYLISLVKEVQNGFVYFRLVLVTIFSIILIVFALRLYFKGITMRGSVIYSILFLISPFFIMTYILLFGKMTLLDLTDFLYNMAAVVPMIGCTYLHLKFKDDNRSLTSMKEE